MKNLKLPDFSAIDVFDACLEGINDASIKSRMQGSRISIFAWYALYDNLARNNCLFQVPVEDNSRPCVVGSVAGNELRSLYINQLLPKRKGARKYYDKILASAPFRKCPFCGFGQATTLDHFLNKTDFSWFSVFPNNLIPCCKDCNHTKSNRHAAEEADQVLHPYYSEMDVSTDQWLFAQILQTSPATVSYYVAAPAHWSSSLATRVVRHFEEFDLAKRYSVEACNEIAGQAPSLKRLALDGGMLQIRPHLQAIAYGYLQHEKNSWKSALFQAMATNDWYCNGGYEMAEI